MGDKSEIQWTDATWNPVTGCSKVSPGCANCYAETLTRRFARTWDVPDLPWTPENAAQNVILHPERLDQPLRWRRPRMVFVNSMSDLFHEQVPNDYIVRVFAVMAASEQYVFQVLTKRPERMRAFLMNGGFQIAISNRRRELVRARDGHASFGIPWPLPNVWLGTSIENRRFVGRADVLRETPAAVRFISAEPLLGPLVYDDWSADGHYAGSGQPIRLRHWRDRYEGSELDLTGIDWVIAGGESGPDARPLDLQWVRDLRDTCLDLRCSACGLAGCDQDCAPAPAFFFKQVGGLTPKAGGRLLDGETWDEFPAVVR